MHFYDHLRNILKDIADFLTALMNISGTELFKYFWVVCHLYFIVLFIRQN